jgi:hypothetical protein
MIDATSTARDIERRCREAGSAERAVSERASLKSDLEHHGAGVWEIRRVARDFATTHRELTRAELSALIGALWARPVHECRMAAVMLLELEARLLGPDDLAGHAAGSLLVSNPELGPRIDAWAVDANFWVRRSALLAQLLPLKRGAGFDTFAGYADAMLEEKEFFIRKAIGWVLRETGKHRPDEVYRWLLPRASRASGVTLREAVKYLDPKQREAVLAAAGKRTR